MKWKLKVTKGRRGGGAQTVNNLDSTPKWRIWCKKTLQEGYLKEFSEDNRVNDCTAWGRKSGRKSAGLLELGNYPGNTPVFLSIVLETPQPWKRSFTNAELFPDVKIFCVKYTFPPQVNSPNDVAKVTFLLCPQPPSTLSVQELWPNLVSEW